MRTVFVVEEPNGQNILPAQKFGNLRILLLKSDIKQGMDHCVKKLFYELEMITCEDYLLPIGDPILIGVATHIAMRVNDDSLNMLRWVREAYSYNVEHITTHGKD